MKKITILLLLFNCCQIILSQNPVNISGCTVWFKDNNSKVNSQDLKELERSNILNFNDHRLISDKEQIIIDRNKLKSNFTMFLVYKSNEQKEKELLKYSVGNEQIQITNQKTKNSSGIEYSKYKSEQGVLLEYSANLNAIKNSNVCILTFTDTQNEIQNEKEKTDILEFIYYPRILNTTERLKIESYLSIKYGISLVGEKNYLSSSNVKIWNKDNNKGFNHAVTGIARDDKSELFQKQSGNSIKDGLYIGFGSYDSINKYNKKDFENNTSLLWADNGKNNSLNSDKSKDEPLTKMDRVWKIQKTALKSKKNLSSFLLIDKNDFFQNKVKSESSNMDKKTLWLLINSNSSESFNYTDAVYYPAKTLPNDKLLFENVIWDKDFNGSDTFTFVEAPNLFMTQELIAKNCAQSESGKIKIKVIGGQSPFLLKVVHNGVVSRFEKNTRDFEIEALESGDYNLTLTDSNNQVCNQIVKTESVDGLNISLASNWYLNNLSEVEIIATTNQSDIKKLNFTWFKEDKIISTDKTLKVYEQGNYSLNVKNDKGCDKTIPFTVNKQQSNNPEVKLYPNPVKSGEPFTIAFDLKVPTDVQIKIININGALLKSQIISKVLTNSYTDTLQTSGSYLIVITTDLSSTTYKLIVN